MESHIDNIKILPEVVSKNGFRYFLVQRSKNKALYKKTYGNVQVGFEVFLIRVRGTQFSPLLNKSVGAAERFPCNEDFGKTAWSIMNYEDALKKYLEL